MRATATGLVLAGCLGACLVNCNEPMQQSDSGVQQDPRAQSDAGVPNTPLLKWSVSMQAPRTEVTDAFVDKDVSGHAYLVAVYQFATPELRIQKRDVAGQLVWEKALPAGVVAQNKAVLVGRHLIGPPVLGPTGEMFLLGREVDSGTRLLIKLSPTAEFAWGTVAPAGDLTLLGSDVDGEVSAIRRADFTLFRFSPDGAVLWSQQLNPAPHDLFAAADRAGNLYLATADDPAAQQAGGTLQRLDRTGAVIWTKVLEHMLPTAIHSAGTFGVVAAADGRPNPRFDNAAWAGAGDANLFAITRDGALAWTHSEKVYPVTEGWACSQMLIGLVGARAAGGGAFEHRFAPIPPCEMAPRTSINAFGPDGASRWTAQMTNTLRSLRFADDGDLLLVVSGTEFIDFGGGVGVTPFDAASPLVIDVGGF